MKKNTENIVELLGPLNTLLKRGEVAYKNYISNEKQFLYAKILKDNNERIRQLILEKSHLLPLDQQSNAIDLVTHIDIWHILWEDLNKRKTHNLDEAFSFENQATFPKESVASLYAFYLDAINKK
ncbi:MAG: hypothetical protein ACI8V2_002994 [Candidatus Latescibacterota bacterium]|jgi:hypothetical protein